MPRPSFRSSDRGFTLVEALVALTLIVVAAASIAQLFVQSTALMMATRRAPVVVAAATSKLEQLEALTFTRDAAGAATHDESTDTTVLPPAPDGGTGLQASPPASLTATVDGFVDYLDRFGRPLGGGTAPPSAAAYVRRWSVAHLTTDLLSMRVCVWTIIGVRGMPDTCVSAARARRP